MLSMYPAGAPGVKNGRYGWAEQYFHTKNNAAFMIHEQVFRAAQEKEAM